MAVAEIHPDIAVLEAFTLGKLDDASLAAVEAHVASCPSCQERGACATGDNLVELLQRVHAGRPDQAETVPPVQTPSPLPVAPAETLPPPALLSQAGAGTTDCLPEELAQHERYRIIRLLGQGGMGAVYEAEHRVMQRPVALKVINRAFTANPAAVERFRREVRAAARLSHPNIVPTYDAEDAGDSHFLVMEYVEGISLARLVKERGPLPVAEACDYVRQAALGLQHAHERGMVHRDVKPDNLMLVASPVASAPGVVKVLDFGLATLTAERGGGLTSANVVMGTPDYMAPEQAEDPRTADGRADVYSLGCTLYYLLTGSVPYPEATSLLKILAHREQPVPAIRQVRPDVSPELSAIVVRLLAKKPEDRYQTPGEVAAALEPFTKPQLANSSDTFAVPLIGESRWPRRRLLIATVAALLLVGVTIAGMAIYHIQTDRGELVITTESDDVEVVIKQGGKTVRIIDTKTDKAITLALRSGVYELELTGAPDGLKLDIDKATLTRGKQTLAKIERAAKPKPVTSLAQQSAEDIAPLHRIRFSDGQRFGTIHLSQDGRYFLATRMNWELSKVRIWEVETGKLIRDLPGAVARFTADGHHVIATFWSGIHVYNVGTGKSIGKFDAKPNVWNLAVPTSGTRLLVATPQSIQIFDWAAGEQLCQIPWNGSDPMLLTPDGRRILVQSAGKALYALDTKAGDEVDAYPQLRNITRIRGMSANGERLLCEDGRNLKVYAMATGRELGVFEAGPEGVGMLSYDGRLLVATTNERDSLAVWDVASHKLRVRLRFPEAVDLNHVRFGGVSRDSRYTAFCTTERVYIFRLPDMAAAEKKP
jgi:serine/threonine protein kinase/WD40 repeat protein